MSDNPETTAEWPSWPDGFIAEHLGLEEGEEAGYVFATSVNPKVLIYRAEGLPNKKPFWQFKAELEDWAGKPVESVEKHLHSTKVGDTLRYTLEPDPHNLPPFIEMIKP